MNKIRFALMALVVTLATLSTPAFAQTTQSGIGACFDTNTTASAGLGGDVRTDFVFEGIPFLLELESYDSGKTLTLYGKSQGKSAEKNELGVYEYSYVPFVTSCSKKDALVSALKKAHPGYKIKFAGDKSRTQQAKDGAQKAKDSTVEGAKKIWGKLSKKP